MIKKVIHYCWFGDSAKPESVLKCINSWKKYCPDYEIIEWNENNFDINCCDYVKEAYENKKYAFVSDFCRVYVLMNYGGVYLDTDVELIKNIDKFLKYSFCMCFQDDEYLNTGFIISKKNNKIIKDILDYYYSTKFVINDKLNMTSNPVIFTKILSKYKLIINNTNQITDYFAIFSNDYFCPMDYKTKVLKKTNNTYAIHWFDGSWLSTKTKIVLVIKRLIKKIIGCNNYEKIKKIIK